jgi:cyclopropane fatty-acyl-phospholipid synthase-like methyltransferase
MVLMSSPPPPRPTTRESFLVTLQLCRILATFSRTRSDLVYNVLSERHVMGDDTLYLNLGYWKEARSLDEAARHLAALLAQKTGFQHGDRVLDVGFGFADQDIQWANAYAGLAIDGLNLSPLQVRAARHRVEKAGLTGRIGLRVGDALDLPFLADTFDHVVALESAFHFRSRRQFFQEALRVLRPGGRIGLADFVAAPPGRPRRLGQRLARFAGVLSWQIPNRNLVSRDQYEQDLSDCGFRNVRVESIGEHVFGPFVAYQRARFDSPEFLRRYHPLIRFMAKLQIDWGFLRTIDYVIATGEKESALAV